MRILLCGSGDFGVPTLSALLGSGHQVVGLLTQPPRPAGRGGKLRATPLAEAAGLAGVDVMAVEKVNAPESVAAIGELRPDVIVVVAFGQFVRAAVRGIPPLGAFNLHGSLLPELRGAAPIPWAIIRGLRRTGVTTFSLVDKMDAGEMYVQMDTEISPEETTVELKARMANIGAAAVLATLEHLQKQGTAGRPQDESKVTFAPILTKGDGVIDWAADATTIRNLIHGTWPWPAGQAVFHGQKHSDVPLEIARAAVEEGPAAGEPGTLDNDLCVATGAGRLRILELKPAGKRLMAWRDFVNGYRVAAGDRFTAPAKPQ